ncbi:type I-F CRISPR-associated protein Csy1 [Pusillimonas sp.]|uniref:type I-F CRISPR-associated protein Csy1 n=1 Tax=Pusillimonas sp. TaxID=3040095 RepID=UPI0037CAA995
MSESRSIQQQMQTKIAAFLQERLQGRLDKLPPDAPARMDLIAQFQPAAWLEDAARRVGQIQAVTHSLKPIHPDARGSNLYVDPASLPSLSYVGSHVLREHFTSDVVGNAAALDVYKFLTLEMEGRSILDWLLADEPSAVAALSDNPETARAWQAAFVGLTQERQGVAASHVRAKQMYWLVGGDATNDSEFHLLAPLFATSLAHAVHGVIQEDRFGEANKAARSARRAGEMHDGVLREYRDLAMQRFGGTKPQNISQLNSERGGVNYLLASLPPIWKQRNIRQPWGLTSVIDQMLFQYQSVRSVLREMLAFLLSDPPSNAVTRNRRDEYVDQLIDELVSLGTVIQQTWPAGWSADVRCEIVMEERLWLDPGRAESDEKFLAEWQKMAWPAQIGHRFGNWLNARLQDHLPVGEVEHRHWKTELLIDESEDGWARRLHKLRGRFDALHATAGHTGRIS